MSYPEAFWLGMDSPAEIVMALAMRSDLNSGFWHQVQIGPYRVDFLVPINATKSSLFSDAELALMAGVVVEVDGFSFHSSEEQFEADRARDRDLTARRKTVVRFSAREVFADPLGCVAEVNAVVEEIRKTRLLERIGSPFIHGMVVAAGHSTWFSEVELDEVTVVIPSYNAAIVA